MRKIAFVVGTRPEAVKLAPLVLEMRRTQSTIVLATGQHGPVVDDILSEFSLCTDYRLHGFKTGDLLSRATGLAVAELGATLDSIRPDAVVVQGDTNSALAGGLAAFYEDVPLVHVEAGLRSGNVRSPYPEEVNRRTLTLLAGLHLAPTEAAAARLLAEGVPASAVTVTGNTVVDALRHVRASRASTDPALARLRADPRKIVVVSLHRRESWGAPMQRVAGILSQLAHAREELVLVVLLHPNMRFSDAFALAPAADNLLLMPAFGYVDFLELLSMASGVITDSGGVQEEAPSFGIRALVLRDVTERTEGVDLGLATLSAISAPDLRHVMGAFIDGMGKGDSGAAMSNPYGDGHASRRAAEAIGCFLDSLVVPV